MSVSLENQLRSIQSYGPGTGVPPLPDAPVEGGHLAAMAWLYAGIPFVTAAIIALSGTSTQANTHLSIVNGTAFVDLLGYDITSYADGAHLITITSKSNGKTLTGYLKAAGTGETLGAELLADPGFDNPASWTAQAGWAVAGSNATAVATIGQVYQTLGDQNGKLLKGVSTITAVTGGTVKFVLSNTVLGAFTSPQAAVAYVTALVGAGLTYSLYGNPVAYSGVHSDFSLKQVLTPSVTGATVVSAPGGGTFNWMQEDVGFNRNDSAGYDWVITGIGSPEYRLTFRLRRRM